MSQNNVVSNEPHLLFTESSVGQPNVQTESSVGRQTVASDVNVAKVAQ